MKHYIGTKRVMARPMTRLEYNTYRGWTLPSDENGDDEGYLVEYMDGGKPNHAGHGGYISWSPKEQFEGAYLDVTAPVAPFDRALFAVKKPGVRIARQGWNGKGMYVYHVPANSQTDLLADDWYLVND